MNSTRADSIHEDQLALPNPSKERIRQQVNSGLDAVKDQLASTGRTIREETLATGHVLKEEVSSAAGRKLEQARTAAADKLGRAARGVEEHVNDFSSPRYQKAATDVAESLKGASRYVGTKSYSEAVGDIRADMSAHPGRWICAGIGLGFLAGLGCQVAMRRNGRHVSDG